MFDLPCAVRAYLASGRRSCPSRATEGGLDRSGTTTRRGLIGDVPLRRHEAGGRPRVAANRRTTTLCALGLVTNLSNPKALLFFLSILPQFLSRSDGSAVPAALAWAVISVLCSLAGLSLWAIASGAFRELLQRPRAQRIQQRVMGTVLVALGLRVALDP